MSEDHGVFEFLKVGCGPLSGGLLSDLIGLWGPPVSVNLNLSIKQDSTERSEVRTNRHDLGSLTFRWTLPQPHKSSSHDLQSEPPTFLCIRCKSSSAVTYLLNPLFIQQLSPWKKERYFCIYFYIKTITSVEHKHL